MKILLLFLAICCFSIAQLIGQSNYIMYKTMYIKPNYANLKEFHENLAKHNKIYHSEGSSFIYIYQVVQGKRAGQYIRVMGPTTFSDLDYITSEEACKKDWNYQVIPNVDKISEVEFWKLDERLSYKAEEQYLFKKFRVLYWNIKAGKEKKFDDLISRFTDVYRKKASPYQWHVYKSVFTTGNKRKVGVVIGFNDWSYFDQPDTWIKDFEEIHGKNSWEKTLKAFYEIVDNFEEEIREYIPELSGNTEK